MDITKYLKGVNFQRIAPFGSRVVGCSKEGSDYDYLVLVDTRPDTNDMHGTGFVPDALDPMYGVHFSSWRKGDVNLVFTDSVCYFEATLDACDFCKKYKVYDKPDRIRVHEGFRDTIILKQTELLI